MVILKRQVNSSSDFSSFFSVITHNSAVNFQLMHFLLWTKGSYQSPNFDTHPRSLVKMCRSFHIIFQTTSQTFFKFYITLQCHEIKLLYTFLGQILYTFHQRNQSKCKLLGLECLDQFSPNSCHC